MGVTVEVGVKSREVGGEVGRHLVHHFGFQEGLSERAKVCMSCP